MSRASLTFEDKGEEVVIGLKNVLSDNRTPAQDIALQFFLLFKTKNAVLDKEKIDFVVNNFKFLE